MLFEETSLENQSLSVYQNATLIHRINFLDMYVCTHKSMCTHISVYKTGTIHCETEYVPTFHILMFY